MFFMYISSIESKTIGQSLFKRSSSAAGRDCTLSVIVDDFYLGSFGRRDRSSAFIMARNEIFDALREVNSIFMNEFQVGLPVVQIQQLNTGYSAPKSLMHTSRDVDHLVSNIANSNARGEGIFAHTRNSCAILYITYQNFGSKLGSAYGVYNGPGTSGGICDKNGFNVATITGFFSNGRLSRNMLISTLAHEIGHMFGAHHDGRVPYPPYGTGNLPQCTPSPDTFIMNSVVKTGRNSRRFSVCSTWSIRSKLNYYSSCFVRRGSAPYQQYGQTY